MDRELEQLRGRFRDLAGSDAAIPGADDVAVGLEKIATHLQDGEFDGDERLALIVRGLSSLAEFLEFEPGADDEQTPSGEEGESQEGLEQFVASFRQEAGKRIQGLSISLMGIFGEEGSDEALEQSTDHLHAIRGGAAMLGLEDVADLAAEMENTLVTERKHDLDDREWPTKTLLRGYALLEEAIDADPLEVADGADEVIDRLRSVTNTARPSTAPQEDGEEDVSRETTASEAEELDEESDEPQLGAEPSTLEQPILIVDDIETIAASVGFVLSELDVPIEVASHGEEALQMLQDKPFSLVISDVDMPRMDGIALTRMIRSDDELGQLPVILLTSLDHPEERQAGMEAGATDYIIKGAIGGGELVRRVEELLEVAPVVERTAQRTKRRILVAEDTETVAASIAFVLSEGPFEIVLANNGKEALRRLDDESFDLLITDMQMPYVDGNELVTTVRADDDLSDLPVLMLTSVEQQDLVNKAARAGVDRYLRKGDVAGGKLLSIVNEMLD